MFCAMRSSRLPAGLAFTLDIWAIVRAFRIAPSTSAGVEVEANRPRPAVPSEPTRSPRPFSLRRATDAPRSGPSGARRVAAGLIIWTTTTVHVREVDRLPPVSPLPNTPAWLLGAASLRGELLSVVDLSAFVGLASVRSYAEAGADLVSVGALTHSAPVLDIGLDLEGEPVS